MNLRIDNCRGQCYDGASSMSGVKSGVATRIMQMEKWALYTHCYGHALNLAAQDSVKHLAIMEDTLDTTYEITNLIKKSPKREVLFKKFKDEITPGSPGVRTLCPTRWTVKADALASISETYEALQLTWDEAKRATKDTEMRARIVGLLLRWKNLIISLDLSWDENVFPLLIIYLGHFKHQQFLPVKVKKLSSLQLKLFSQCDVRSITLYFGSMLKAGHLK